MISEKEQIVCLLVVLLKDMQDELAKDFKEGMSFSLYHHMLSHLEGFEAALEVVRKFKPLGDR